MKNKHIELVKKWLAAPKSVSQEELEANYEEACAAAASASDATYDAARAARAAGYAASAGAWAARTAGYADGAERWVKRYEELTNDK